MEKMDEIIKASLLQELNVLESRVKSCKDWIENGDEAMYKHYVQEIEFWSHSVVRSLFDNFINKEA